MLFGLMLLGGHIWLQSTLPDYTRTLKSDALGAPVKISRDRYGVPHIEAKSFRDAAFAMGYAQAQDRFWQMQTMRRAVQGRTAEIFGEALIPTDIAYRVHASLPDVAAKSAGRIDPETQKIFQAFADGVNFAIEKGEATSSPEWDLLGIKPEPWTMSDSNNFMTIISETATDGERELLVETVAKANSPRLESLLFDPIPETFPTLYRDFQTPSANETETPVVPSGSGDSENPAGTNFFAFAPSKTTTGQAILAVDPHLPTHAPSMLYPVSIELPDDFIAGAAWVGSPSVAFGQNKSIAWGLTHLYADTFDYIVERIDPENPQNYLTPEGSKPFAIDEIIIPVKGGEDRRIVRRRTQNGVIVSDPIANAQGEYKEGMSEKYKIVEETFGPGHVVARRQLAVEEGQTTMQAYVKVSRAHSWDEFRDALRDYEWTNNFVFADTKGNIGVQMAARLPQRRKVNGWDGQRLARGWLGEGQWEGYIPFDDLPNIFNPPQGWVADANSRTVDDTIPFRVTDNFAPPWRVVRAYEMIDEKDQHDLESVSDIQLDPYTAQGAWLVERLSKFEMTSERNQEAIAILTQWDFKMLVDRPEPLLYAAIELALQQRLINIHGNAAASRTPNTIRISRALSNESKWCDHPQTDQLETCAQAVNEAFDMAITAVSAEYGADISKWKWGDKHRAEFPAQYAWANVPLLDGLTRTQVPTPGGDNTLNSAAGGRPDASFDDLLSNLQFIQGHGATYRLIADLGDPKRSLMSFAPGMSGNAASKHWDDMARPWAAGKYLNLLPSKADQKTVTTIKPSSAQ